MSDWIKWTHYSDGSDKVIVGEAKRKIMDRTVGIDNTKFWEWYKKMYEGPDGDFPGIPDWHKDDMSEAWCAGLESTRKRCTDFEDALRAIKENDKLTATEIRAIAKSVVREQGDTGMGLFEVIGEAVDTGDFVEVIFNEDAQWYPGEKVYRVKDQ